MSKMSLQNITGYAIIFLSIFMPLISKSQVDSILRNQIDKIIFYDTNISFEKIPGFIIGIVDGDSTYTFIYGDTAVIQVSDTCIYEIGGLTKVFTAHLCEMLVQENKINYESPINNYIPERFRNSALDNIRIRNLITHTSGLPVRPLNLGEKMNNSNDPYQGYTKEILLNYIKQIQTLQDTGRYLYSHLNYGLLEIILEKALQEDFNSLLDQYIFMPAMMKHSYITASDKIICPGFDRSGRKTNIWSFPSFAASEGIKTTVTDLVAYMQKQLQQRPKSFNSLLIPTQKIAGTKRTYVAKGWHLFKSKKGYQIYLHSGKTNGHAASIHFIPHTQTAVILLTNSPGKMDGLATLVLRMLNYNWKRKS